MTRIAVCGGVHSDPYADNSNEMTVPELALTAVQRFLTLRRADGSLPLVHHCAV